MDRSIATTPHASPKENRLREPVPGPDRGDEGGTAERRPQIDTRAMLTRARSRVSRPVLAAGLVYGLLLVVMLRVPALGIALSWPLLFFVPGYLLVSRILPEQGTPGRVGLSVIVSVFVSAHLAYLVGVLYAGINGLSLWVTLEILATACVVLATTPIRGLAAPPRFDLTVSLGRIREYRAPLALAALTAAVIGGVWLYGAWHLTSDGWVAGGWNWSDLLVHTSISQSILDGNFPPQVPYFSGVPLLYHWFADFHAALASATSGIDIITVYALVAGFMAGTFVLLVWALAEALTGHRRTALIAAALAIFGGGLGYMRLGIDLAQPGADLFKLLSTNSYDNIWSGTWPYFRIPSVLGTGFLAHRATTVGLPALIGVVLLVHLSLGKRPAGMLVAGVLAALLAPFHFYFFPATYLVVLLYFIAVRGWREERWLRDTALFLAPLLLAVPFIAPALFQQAGNGTFRFVIGWTEAPLDEGLLSVAFFYVTNFGVPLLLAAWAALTGSVPARLFLVVWVVALFLVPNLVVAGAVVFDMNKYFQVMWVAVAILAGWAIRNWPRPALAAVLGLSALSPALVSVWHLTSHTVAMSVGGKAAAQWIESNTEPRSVFMTDNFLDSPVDLSGRLRLTTYPPYVANLGYRPDQRVDDVLSAWCDGPERARDVMLQYGADYVLSTGGYLECSGAPTNFDTSPLFQTIYDAAGIKIWTLAGS